VVEDAERAGGINTGIGVVVPAAKGIEAPYQPELKQRRRELTGEC
jgi:hypothetical protein